MGDFVSAPAPTSGGFSKEEHLGELLVLEIFGITKETGDYGEQDVIIGNVHMLDGPLAGHTYDEQTIYGRRLVGQARATLNAGANRMLGRLSRDHSVKKGQPPWILSAPTDEDTAKAETWAAAQDGTADTAAPGTADPVAVAPTPSTATAAPSEPPF